MSSQWSAEDQKVREENVGSASAAATSGMGGIGLGGDRLADDLSASASAAAPDPSYAAIEKILDGISGVIESIPDYLRDADGRERQALLQLTKNATEAAARIRKFMHKDPDTDAFLVDTFGAQLDDLDGHLFAITNDGDFSLAADYEEPVAAAAPDVAAPRSVLLMHRASGLGAPTVGGVNKLKRSARMTRIATACREMLALKQDMLVERDGAEAQWWDGFETLVGELEGAAESAPTEYAALHRAGVVEAVSGLLAMADGGLVCNEELPSSILGRLK